MWLERTTGPFVVKPVPDIDQRIAFQRIHDTTKLAKFAFSRAPASRVPAARPGASACVRLAMNRSAAQPDDHDRGWGRLLGLGRSLPRGFRCSGRGRLCAPGPLGLG